MTKRRLDEGGFANVLRQKHRVDPILKQESAQNTFALLMNAQRTQSPRSTTNETSYKYFNAEQPQAVQKCHRCSRGSAQDKCTFCEFFMCQDCLQQCSSCQHIYCNACSILDYSLSTDQVFCISCKQSD